MIVRFCGHFDRTGNDMSQKNNGLHVKWALNQRYYRESQELRSVAKKKHSGGGNGALREHSAGTAGAAGRALARRMR